MHKTEEQRLKEQLMREQLEQTKIITKQSKLGYKLYQRQVDLQIQMADVQNKMMKENPEQFMKTSEKDEENLEEKEAQKSKSKEDFIEIWRLKKTHDILNQEYRQNEELLKSLNLNSKILQENFRNYINYTKKELKK